MRRTRSWVLVALALGAVAVGTALVAAIGRSTSVEFRSGPRMVDGPCPTQLDDATVDLVFDPAAGAVSHLTITVPDFADATLLMAGSRAPEGYLVACLFGSPAPYRAAEPPVFTLENGTTTVRATYPFAVSGFDLWELESDPDGVTYRLAPSFLTRAHWRTVTVRGVERVDAVSPAPTDAEDGSTFIWRRAADARGAPDLAVSVSRSPLAAWSPTRLSWGIPGLDAAVVALGDLIPYLVPIIVLAVAYGRLPRERRGLLTAHLRPLLVLSVLPVGYLLMVVTDSWWHWEGVDGWSGASVVTGLTWTALLVVMLAVGVGAAAWNRPGTRVLAWAIAVGGLCVSLAQPVARRFGVADVASLGRPEVLTQDILIGPYGILAAISIAVLLRARSRRRDRPDGGDAAAPGEARGAGQVEGTDRWLIAFVFVVGTVSWPISYADIPLSLAALVAILTVMGMLRLTRSLSTVRRIREASGGRDLDPDRLRAVQNEYQLVLARAANLEKDWLEAPASSESPAAEREQLLTRQAAMREELAGLRLKAGMADAVPAAIDPVDASLAWGPERTWWENGRRTALIAGAVGIPFALGLLYSGYHRTWRLAMTGSDGLLWLLTDVAESFLMFVFAGFALGCLWRELPGDRGVLKGWPLVVAHLIATGADAALHLVAGEPVPNDLITSSLLLLVVLGITGAWVDIVTLQYGSQPWTRWTTPFVSAYRLGTVWTSLVFFVTQLAAFLALWSALQSGIGLGAPSGMIPGGP